MSQVQSLVSPVKGFQVECDVKDCLRPPSAVTKPKMNLRRDPAYSSFIYYQMYFVCLLALSWCGRCGFKLDNCTGKNLISFLKINKGHCVRAAVLGTHWLIFVTPVKIFVGILESKIARNENG